MSDAVGSAFTVFESISTFVDFKSSKNMRIPRGPAHKERPQWLAATSI